MPSRRPSAKAQCAPSSWSASRTERRRDMTGPTEVASDKAIAPRVGGSAAFRAFIRDELFPAIDVRVRGDGHRAIIGESPEGLFIVETFFLAPEMFDTYIAPSPTLWWNDRALVRAEPGGDVRAHPCRDALSHLVGDDEGGEIVGVPLVNHVIVAGKRHSSLLDIGLIPQIRTLVPWRLRRLGSPSAGRGATQDE
jgi:Putative esterase